MHSPVLVARDRVTESELTVTMEYPWGEVLWERGLRKTVVMQIGTSYPVHRIGFIYCTVWNLRDGSGKLDL